MANGRIADAEVELLLSTVPEAHGERDRWRFLLTCVKQITIEAGARREVCDARERICPAMHPADPVAPVPQRLSRETWVMWGVGRTLLLRVALPSLVVLVGVLIGRLL